MKHSVSLLICIILLLPAVNFAQEATTTEEVKRTVNVKIVGLKNDKGEVQLALSNSEGNYALEEAEPFRDIAIPIAHKQAEAIFEELPFGEYAIKLYLQHVGTFARKKQHRCISQELGKRR